MEISKAVGIVTALLALQPAAQAADIMDSELADSYHFVDRYQVVIDRPADEVWPQLLDFGSWMFDFDMEHVSGPYRGEGEVFRIYGGQDFFLEVVKLIPGRLIVVVNQPSSMQGEQSVGIAMLTLAETGGATLVSNFVSRQYDWTQDGPNPLRATRASDSFQATTRNQWQQHLLRLRELVEARQ